MGEDMARLREFLEARRSDLLQQLAQARGQLNQVDETLMFINSQERQSG